MRTAESQVEQAIIDSNEPIPVYETEEVSVLGHRGIWVNKREVEKWNGPSLSEYRYNDEKPVTILKPNNTSIEYTQNVMVKYLRPPTPPPPGDLVIRNETESTTLIPPPQIIREVPERSRTPEPIIIREAPPRPPSPIQRKVVKIVDKTLTLPPRRIVVEKLPKLPPKPQPVIIERWLPYEKQKRKVVYEKSTKSRAVSEERPKNLIVQWDSPHVNYKTSINWLGIESADPEEYKRRYGTSLVRTEELPQFVKDIEKEAGYKQHIGEKRTQSDVLEGDLHALRLIDLERENLGRYKKYLTDEGRITII